MGFLHLSFRISDASAEASASPTDEFASRYISHSRNTTWAEMYNNNTRMNYEASKNQSATVGSGCEMSLPPTQNFRIDEPD
jgi:hypothetical protein